MPHPHFNTISEENSYWRHYDNYIVEQEEAKQHFAVKRQEKKNKKKSTAPAPKPNRQGLVAAEDGWFTVVSTKKH